jgi:diguanylate cyclase (GGDEF)-like protein
MKRIFQTPDSAFPLALSLVLLALVAFEATLLPGKVGWADGSGWLLSAFLVVGIAMAQFRPRRGLSLGAAALVPTTLYFGPIIAGILAGVLRATQLLGRPPVERTSARTRARLGVGSLLTSSLVVALAGLTAASAWHYGVAPGAGRWSSAALLWACVAGLLQATMIATLDWIAGWAGVRSVMTFEVRDPLLLLDVAGWAVGGTLVGVFATAELGVSLAVLMAVVALVVELTRNELLLARRKRQIATLSEMSSVSHRMGSREPQLARVAEGLLAECRKLVPAQWLELELIGPADKEHCWHANTEGVVAEGRAEPPEAPPPIPGVHKRVQWQVLEKNLESGEQTFAKLKLWTDPRQVEWEQLELLETLLPQLATSLAAVLLDYKAHRDALTGVATRAVLEDRVEAAYELCCAEGRSMAVVMCDVDHFKSINDEHGHAVGDRALQEVAAALEGHCRDGDLCCRYGGEEFTVLMEGASGKPALAAAERLRKAVEALRIHVGGATLELTASLGVASFPETYVESGAELVPLADSALYEAKRRGRNRSLLALGQGRFQNARGRRLKGHIKSEEIEAPRLFV